jgi:hypothetical protein
MEVSVLGSVEGDPGNNLRRIATAEGVGAFLVWRIVREKSLYPYHIQRVQVLIPPDPCARAVFRQCLLSKCIVSTQFVANILFTYEAGFTMDVLQTFIIHMSVWMITPTQRLQQQFSVNI